MFPISSRGLVALVALLAVFGVDGPAAAQSKLDRALHDGKQAGKTQRVILKSKPGYEAWARFVLEQSSKSVDAELPSVGAFAVELGADELDAYCGSVVFDSCSEDATVRPSGQLRKGRGARRRSGCGLQLERSDVVRRPRET